MPVSFEPTSYSTQPAMAYTTVGSLVEAHTPQQFNAPVRGQRESNGRRFQTGGSYFSNPQRLSPQQSFGQQRPSCMYGSDFSRFQLGISYPRNIQRTFSLTIDQEQPLSQPNPSVAYGEASGYISRGGRRESIELRFQLGDFDRHNTQRAPAQVPSQEQSLGWQSPSRTYGKFGGLASHGEGQHKGFARSAQLGDSSFGNPRYASAQRASTHTFYQSSPSGTYSEVSDLTSRGKGQREGFARYSQRGDLSFGNPQYASYLSNAQHAPAHTFDQPSPPRTYGGVGGLAPRGEDQRENECRSHMFHPYSNPPPRLSSQGLGRYHPSTTHGDLAQYGSLSPMNSELPPPTFDPSEVVHRQRVRGNPTTRSSDRVPRRPEPLRAGPLGGQRDFEQPVRATEAMREPRRDYTAGLRASELKLEQNLEDLKTDFVWPPAPQRWPPATSRSFNRMVSSTANEDAHRINDTLSIDERRTYYPHGSPTGAFAPNPPK